MDACVFPLVSLRIREPGVPLSVSGAACGRAWGEKKKSETRQVVANCWLPSVCARLACRLLIERQFWQLSSAPLAPTSALSWPRRMDRRQPRRLSLYSACRAEGIARSGSWPFNAGCRFFFQVARRVKRIVSHPKPKRGRATLNGMAKVRYVVTSRPPPALVPSYLPYRCATTAFASEIQRHRKESDSAARPNVPASRDRPLLPVFSVSQAAHVFVFLPCLSFSRPCLTAYARHFLEH